MNRGAENMITMISFFDHSVLCLLKCVHLRYAF